LAQLVEGGVEALTMLAVANRAGASKETLYAWFGNRDGLLTALVERNADASARRVAQALDGDDDDPRGTLVGYAEGLLTLLTSPASIALNRAAMSSPPLADLLLRSGRRRIGPLVERYLARLATDGLLRIEDSPAAYRRLYGLVVQDTQIRVLLGEAAPGRVDIRRRARTAVDDFLALTAR
jgi:AcrR family transcriptional regulator